ncbi:MAG: hypothetical protein AB7V42_03095 [Thermoleophilia bacterium]
MGPRLIGLAALLARRQGAAAAQALLRSGRAWMADPANDETRRALLEQLRTWSERAGGAVAVAAQRITKEIEKRKVSPAAWERDLMALRYEIADMAPGPMREAALDAYAAQARAGVHLITASSRPGDARREVLRTLRAEASMLKGEPMTADERERAMAAVDEALRACAGDGAGAAS